MTFGDIMIKKMNDIDELYDGANPIPDGDGFKCPVCIKKLKTEKGMLKHIAERDCYDVKALFAFTHHEEKALILFQSVMADVAPQARTSPSAFRKNKAYAGFIKFVIFCALHQVQDMELYFGFIRDVMGFRHVNGGLSAGIKETTLSKFRQWLMTVPEFIDSATFIDRYRDDLIEDSHFLIRSLEKAHVHILDVVQEPNLDIDSLEDRLPVDYWNRLMEITHHSIGDN